MMGIVGNVLGGGKLRLMWMLVASCMISLEASVAAQEKPETVAVDVPLTAARAVTIIRPGATEVRATVFPVEGKERLLTFKPFNITSGIPDTTLANAGIALAELGIRNYFRPNPLTFDKTGFEKTVLGWGGLPGPQTWAFPLEFRNGADGVECYFDGKYAGLTLPGGKLKRVALSLPKGAKAEPFTIGDSGSSSLKGYYLLDVGRTKAAAGAEKAVCKLSSRASVPMFDPVEKGLDLGVTATGPQSGAGAHHTSYYTYRGAFDNLNDTFIFTVPRAQYTRAWVLAAVDESAGKDPVLTARLTRFVSDGPYTGRARECLADTSMTLPKGSGARPSEGVTRMGSAEVGGKTMSLYLVEIPLDSGNIQDLIFNEQGEKQRGTCKMGPYLDFELLGRLKRQDRPAPFGDNRMLPDSRHASGVHVFGVTLEKTPAEMEIRQTQPGNIFHNDEKPEALAALRALADGDYELTWTIKDVDGKKVGGETRKLSMKAADGEMLIPVSMAQPRLGWYEIVFELSQSGRRLLTHNASFALLGEDTRKAGYESPYATWWMQSWHYGVSDPKIAGALMMKAGFRRTQIVRPDLTSEEELAPWKVTMVSVGWGRLAGLLKQNASDEEIEKHIADQLRRYPHCDNIMIFHESMPELYRNAPEIFGLPPMPDVKGAQERYEMAARAAKIIRGKFPQLKIVIGNSLASTELLAELFRRKFPESHADYMGVETVGRTCMPERISEYGQAGGAWLLKEAARKFNYNWGVTSCLECNYRQDRLLGGERKAQWYARDMLLGHAHKFPYICLAGIDSFGNSYNSSFWGDTALCDRNPLLYPRKSYVSVATLTKVLDQVKLLREIPTGGDSVYALEFSRADKKTIQAIWAGRGTAELRLTFPTDGEMELVDMYGRSKKVATNKKTLDIVAGTAVQYLVGSQAVSQSSLGKRTYPEDQPWAGFKKAAGMDKADDWRIDCSKNPMLELCSIPHLPFRTAGNYEMRAAADDEKGACLEVELKPGAPELPTPLMSEYAVVRLKNPVVLDGRPDTLGVWVKGNSGWGQVYFELEDAKGVRMMSCGTTEHKGDVFDYDGRMSVNFDGWSFLSIPVTEASPIPDLSTGSVRNLWERGAKDKLTAPVYPLKLTGVAVSLPRQALRLTEMRPVRQILRLKDVMAFENTSE